MCFGGHTRQDARNELGAAAKEADPFAPYRAAMGKRLADLFTPGKSASTLAQTPGYQFSLQQGQQAISRRASRLGQLGSGNLLENLDKYSQGLAQQTFQQQATDLTNLAAATPQNAIAGAQINAGKAKITLGHLAAHNALLGNLVGAAGSIGGAMIGGPIGAGIGGSFGKMFGGGGGLNQRALSGTSLGLGPGGLGSLNTSMV